MALLKVRNIVESKGLSWHQRRGEASGERAIARPDGRRPFLRTSVEFSKSVVNVPYAKPTMQSIGKFR